MLKKLTLQGFKSFAEKTELEFPSRITAIVGPNGAGKSNIVDGIRWVLGEQSLKNIRLSRSEDVIFSGTPAHAASGFAEVSLLFDNSSNIFPVEYAEVSIGRKLYRDGTSIYLLNRKEVRLKDIVRLMAGAKLGTKGLAIVTQGAGDAFLAASPKDRREMLEEVLGLKEYRMRKEDADRKMTETTYNLERVSALIQELEPHLRSLKRQVSRWEKRQEKAALLKDVEREYFHCRLASIVRGDQATRDEEALREEIETMHQEIADLEQKSKGIEMRLADFRQMRIEEDKKIQEMEHQRSEILRKLGNIEGKLEALQTETSIQTIPSVVTLMDILKRTKSEIEMALADKNPVEIRERLRRLVVELERVLAFSRGTPSSATDLFEQEKREFTEALAVVETEIRRLKDAFAQRAQIWEQATDELHSIFEELERKRRILREKQSLMQEYKLESEKRKIQEEDLRSKMEEAGWDYDEFYKDHADTEPPQGADVKELELRILRLRRELADIGAVDEELVKEYHAANERYEFLVTQKEDAERALTNLKRLSGELQKKIDREFNHALKEISEQFQRFFRLIFGGGSAHIKETHPRTILLKDDGVVPLSAVSEDEEALQELPEPETNERGLEIAVTLPRKKIKSLDMLSGGERALTAISLIFAVIWTSSPPFLVLDEIDAPLDESNSQRFSKLLVELAAKTQFVLITHNRVTMEAADVLYGVSMQDGVSKVFSVKFEEAEKMATKDVHPARN